MPAIYTTPAIAEILKEFGLNVRKVEGRNNFQVTIPNEVLGKLSDSEKARVLVKVEDTLKAAGYNARIQLSYRRQGEEQFRAYPCVWVNETERTAAATAEVTALKSEVSDLKGLVVLMAAKMGVEVPKTEEKPAEGQLPTGGTAQEQSANGDGTTKPADF